MGILHLAASLALQQLSVNSKDLPAKDLPVTGFNSLSATQIVQARNLGLLLRISKRLLLSFIALVYCSRLLSSRVGTDIMMSDDPSVPYLFYLISLIPPYCRCIFSVILRNANLMA